jgi:hypothetical protein
MNNGAKDVPHLGRKRNAYKIFVGKNQGKGLLGRPDRDGMIISK